MKWYNFDLNNNKYLFVYFKKYIKASPISYGQTVCDVYNAVKKRKNVHVCLKMIDVEKFWQIMLDSIKLADANSPINIS